MGLHCFQYDFICNIADIIITFSLINHAYQRTVIPKFTRNTFADSVGVARDHGGPSLKHERLLWKYRLFRQFPFHQCQINHINLAVAIEISGFPVCQMISGQQPPMQHDSICDIELTVGIYITANIC